METAQKNCKPGGPAELKFLTLKNEVKMSFMTIIK